MNIKFKKLHRNAVIPTYAKDGDAGLDLVTVEIEWNAKLNLVIYKTGLAVEIPDGYCGLLFPRSSNSNKDLFLSNSVGIIDSGYRGEIILKYKPIGGRIKYVDNDIVEYIADYKTYVEGDKVGQLLILPYPKIEPVEAEELSATERGTNGFGSTGR